MRPTLSCLSRLAAPLALVLALTGAPVLAHDGVHVTDPYARSAGGIGASGAIFFTIENHQVVDDRLISAASDVAERVEIHAHVEDANGVMQMKHLEDGLEIPASAETAFARGGNHVMLLGLKRELEDGDKITLTLTFERAGVVEVEVPVDNARKPEGHAGHGAHGAAHGAAPASE